VNRRRALLGLVSALGLARSARAAPVDAADYDAFWLWAGVTPQPVLAKAHTLYLLAGQIDALHGGAVRLIAQGGTTPRLRRREVWIVFRAHTLAWPPHVYDQVLGALARWQAAGVPVVGVQIDFDAHTRHLDQYGAFLHDLRGRLPADCRLSITGLLDWSSQGDPDALSALGGVIDEVVLQTYQGRRTIPGYGAYLARLGRLKIPFKIGLIQGGEWTPPPDLEANPRFRGYVVFLKNPRPDVHLPAGGNP